MEQKGCAVTLYKFNAYGILSYRAPKAYNQTYGQGNISLMLNQEFWSAGSTLYVNIEADGNCNYIVSGYFTH